MLDVGRPTRPPLTRTPRVLSLIYLTCGFVFRLLDEIAPACWTVQPSNTARGAATMPREGAPAKARRYLGEGRLIVHRAGPGIAAATCRGDGTVHHLGYRAGGWWCTYPARTDQCSHLVAARLCLAPDLGDVG